MANSEIKRTQNNSILEEITKNYQPTNAHIGKDQIVSKAEELLEKAKNENNFMKGSDIFKVEEELNNQYQNLKYN